MHHMCPQGGRTRSNSIVFLFILALLATPLHAQSIISDVISGPTELNMLSGGEITISWQLLKPARVSVFIIDGRGHKVRTLSANQEYASGNFSLVWDGKDKNDQPCQNGVYVPVIKAKTQRMGTMVYNPTLKDWGHDVPVNDIEFSKDAGTVSFSIEQPAYARLMAGLQEGGPVFKTIAGWRFYSPGSHVLEWDGRDTDQLTEVTAMENFSYSFDSFSLPENTIIITGSEEASDSSFEGFESFPFLIPSGSKISYYALDPDSRGPEPKVHIQWPGCTNQNKPELTGMATTIVSWADAQLPGSTFKGQAELVIYIDDEFVEERSVTELPATLTWDTGTLANGEHKVTVNLLTLDHRVGILSHYLLINN